MTREDMALACFALGRFVQYRLDEGLPQENLADFMQAYENLCAELEDREPFPIFEVHERLAAAGLDGDVEDNGWPSWLHGHMRLCRHILARSAQGVV